MTVCVVDACPQDYESLVTASASSGVRFQFATTGSDALKLSRTATRSIWLVNIHLPDGPGCDLAAALRTRDPHSVVYLVGDHYDGAEEREARLTRGALYVCKPVDPGWLPIEDVPIRLLRRCA